VRHKARGATIAWSSSGALTFGVPAEVDKLNDANPVVRIKSYKVTAAE
jgi:hypothetical protein